MSFYKFIPAKKKQASDWLNYLVYQLEACFYWREKPIELICPDSNLRKKLTLDYENLLVVYF